MDYCKSEDTHWEEMESWKLGLSGSWNPESWGLVGRPCGCWGLCAPMLWWVFFTSSRDFFIPSGDCFSIPGWGGNPGWSGETGMTSPEAVTWDSPCLLRTTPHLDPQLDSSLQVPQGEVQSMTHDEAHKTGKNYLSVLFSIHFLLEYRGFTMLC